MSSPDDIVYRKNVRNMAVVLAAIVLTIFAALFIPPYIFPPQAQFLPSVSVNSAYGFTLIVQLNSTTVSSSGAVNITGVVENASGEILNVSSLSSWSVSPTNLARRPCTSGWPLGVGVMRGYLTPENYSLGSLVSLSGHSLCPLPVAGPSSYLIQSHGSIAIVKLGPSLAQWNLETSLAFNPSAGGTYTAVVADEWGDIVLTHFRVA
jgi:hypothetical protein